MAIRNEVIFGLKVSFNFSDIESKAESLRNLGLDIRDLDVIRGVNTSVSKVDLQNVSGLDVNLTRYLDRLKSDSGRYRGIVNDLSGYQFRTRGNFEAYGPISGGAVRYKYIPNDKGPGLSQSDLKYGDISTSRVSSWSSATADETNITQAISYGASVQVKGALQIGQNSQFTPGVGEALINVLDTPEPIRFATEVPTDVLELDINGQQQFVYAMRGIPIIFTTAFRNISMDFGFIAFGTLNPIFTFQATDGSEQEITSIPTVSNFVSRLRYNSTSYKEREVRLYYPPNNITSITGRSINIRFFPKVKFKNLEYVDLESNLIGEMPDWNVISYDDNFISQLNTIRIQNNPLYQSENEDLQFFGTKVVERFPKSLNNLYMSGTYYANTTFLTAENSLALQNITQTEYNLISPNRSTTQTYQFAIEGVDLFISGNFFDKHVFDGIYYAYVREPQVTDLNGTPLDPTTITNFVNYFQPIDLKTRCPNLQTLYMRNSSGRYIYNNSNSRYPSKSNPWNQYTNGQTTPRVNLQTIRTYDLYDNYYTVLEDSFVNPGNYLDANESSSLRTFNVGENEALTSAPIDFSKMTNIESINIADTALPIPSNLQNRSSLRTVSCSTTRFPARGAAAIYDSTTGIGNAGNANNFFFTNKNPVAFTEYVFSGCNNLSSLSFYDSRIDGMIPKFIGNNSLSSIDLRYTSIEGGRPESVTDNNGLPGRRYIMWDDTFEDAQGITSIRIRSDILGRNTGVYQGNGVYTEASFQGSTFNLPLLETLEIVSTGKLIKGGFFNTSVAPSLKTLISNNTGWGEDLGTGTPVPTFAGNPNIEYIDLSQNKFTGNINLNNLTKLREFYLSSNDLSGVGTFKNLSSLTYFIVGNNNNLIGDLPNFSTGSPNIQYISMNNCAMTGFNPGSLSEITRLRSLDLSNNSFNQGSIDAILQDLVDNYDNAPRSNVIVNLLGTNMAAPSAIVISTPTQSTALAQSEEITVSHPGPTANFGPSPTRTLELTNTATLSVGDYLKQDNTGAYGKIQSFSGTSVVLDNTDTNANGTLFNTTDTLHLVANSNGNTNSSNILENGGSPVLLSGTDPGIEQIVISYTPNDPLYQFTFGINLRDGFDPPGQLTFEYETKIFLDGTDITSSGLITIDYASEVVTFVGNSPGNVTNYPADGAKLKAEVYRTTYGVDTRIEGGITLKNYLNQKGWIVRTN
jgi:hypothetical protein